MLVKRQKKLMTKKKKKTKNNIPIKSDLKRPKEFELFANWMAMSPLLRLLSNEELKKIGVNDPEEMRLLEIKTQKDFAEKFDLGEDTLVDWKQRDDFWELVDNFELKWGRQKTPSVLAGFYRKAISEADAPRVKLWLQYFKRWQPMEKISFDFEKEVKNVKEKYQ